MQNEFDSGLDLSTEAGRKVRADRVRDYYQKIEHDSGEWMRSDRIERITSKGLQKLPDISTRELVAIAVLSDIAVEALVRCTDEGLTWPETTASSKTYWAISPGNMLMLDIPFFYLSRWFTPEDVVDFVRCGVSYSPLTDRLFVVL